MATGSDSIFAALGRKHVHPFPARMAPELVSEIISSFDRPIRVLDPMMGSGTVLALAQAKRHRAIGFDIDPLAVLISSVWTTAVSEKEIKKKAEGILARSQIEASTMKLRDAYPAGASQATKRFVSYWFDGNARRQLTSLSSAISKVRDQRVRNVLWCAFSRLIIAKQAGASLALDLAHSRPHRYYSSAPSKPFAKFLEAVDLVLKSCPTKSSRRKGPVAKSREGDARALPLKAGTIDLVMTSPPYLNAIDYIRCSKFSLVWMGYSIEGLTKVRSESVGTEVGRFLAHDKEITRILKRLDLQTLSRRRLSIVTAYVDDMRSAMIEVARVLSPGGQAVYVVGENTIEGIYVKNASILKFLAKSAGLTIVGETSRPLPPNKRYLPPPTKHGADSLDTRMRAEVVLRFRKPH
jgi:DNA modification methylase